MRLLQLVLIVALVLSSVAAAFAEDGKEGGKAKPPAVAPKTTTPVSIDALLVSAGELPKDTGTTSGIHAISTPPRTFYAMPEMKGFLPKPTRKATQSFTRDGKTVGTVFLFEYRKGYARKKAKAFLSGFLYGEGSRSKTHPEEVIYHDRHLILLSMPIGDATAEWYKHRLREKFRIPALRHRKEHRKLIGQILRAYNKNDAAAGLAICAENAKAVEDNSFASFLLGELGMMKGDWKTCERGYRRALALHESLEDPLAKGTVWASTDGLGTALVVQKKLAEAVPTLKRAQRIAKEAGLDASATTSYNLACAYSLLGKLDEAYPALREAIKLDVKQKEQARTDADLAKAREQKRFQKLLAE